MAVIRKAAVSDAENILEYCKAVGAETDNLTFGAEGISLTVEKEREYLKSFTDSDKQLYLVAEENNEIVGTAVFSGLSKARLSHRAEISISVKKQCGAITSAHALWNGLLTLQKTRLTQKSFLWKYAATTKEQSRRTDDSDLKKSARSTVI